MFTEYKINKLITITCIVMVIIAAVAVVFNMRASVPNDERIVQIAEKNWASVGGYYINYRLADNDRKTVLNVQDVYYAPTYTLPSGNSLKNVVVVQERLSETRFNYFIKSGGYYRLLDYHGDEILRNVKVTAVPSKKGKGLDIILSLTDKTEKDVQVKYVLIGGFTGEVNENKERKVYEINGEH